MADPTRPLTPAPDDSWPAPDDAAVRRLVEALTADATPEELSDEARYIAAFTTLMAPAEPGAAPGRRRGRLVLVAAAAALAVTGTAAAVTGTMGWPTAPPHPRTPSSTTSAPNLVPPPSVPAGTTRPGPSSAASPHATAVPNGTPRPTPTTTTTSPSSTTSPESTSPSAVPSPAASPSPSSSAKLPPTPALRAHCRSYLRGKVKPGSKKYRELVEAAGGADRLTAYCTALVSQQPQS